MKALTGILAAAALAASLATGEAADISNCGNRAELGKAPTQAKGGSLTIFGLTAEEVAARRREGYSPSEILAGSPELGKTIDLIDAGFFSPGNLTAGRPIVERLLSEGETFFVLADFAAYAAAQDAVDALYRDGDAWTRKAVTNTLNMGMFSSDRSVREYAQRIWRIKPVL